MFKIMDANDRAYHAGASGSALIVEDEDFPAMIVIDGDRIEVYWTDDELDAWSYYKISSMPEAIGVGVHLDGFDYRRVQARLQILLKDLGFKRI